ncbi:AraC family transcriptional regulator [Sphingobacterium sp.]|uniref:AraC family transcriptional regulator n=1 Tax=Sphingobacterium sp. TaxID=341027 RepID=UPI00289F130D|nr:AraC family transcriptional regulator [Sphingobacterium sp.]
MVDDYELFFNEEPLNIREVTGLPPASCLHPLKNTSISLQYNFTGAVLHRQRFVLKQFQMELLQLDSGEAFRFGCRPLKDRLFILFCLDGEIRFTTGQGRQITAARKGYFYISRGNAGSYYANCPRPGTNLVLFVSISPAWAKRKVKSHLRLKKALTLLLESNRPFGVMPHCAIGEDVMIWLHFLERFSNLAKKNFPKLLRDMLVSALGYYENMLEQRSNDPIYKVKEYIEQNYTDPGLNIHRISEQFCYEEKTMRKKFVMEFHVTPAKYLTMVRLKEAQRLIDEMGLTITAVWAKVGYNDIETFRQAYGR